MEPTLHLPSDASDDPGFIDLAARAIYGAAVMASTKLIHVVKVDSWFGDCWFAFSGKAVGALGIRDYDTLRIPPFHPHRVMIEVRFRTSDPPESIAFDKALHTRRSSESNLKIGNAVVRLDNSITIGWYSGNTSSSGRGSIMVYTSIESGSTGWYVGLKHDQEWGLVRLVGIVERQWAAMIASTPAAH